MVVPDAVIDFLATDADELRRVGTVLVTSGLVYALARWLVEPAVDRVVRRSNPGNPTLQQAVHRHLRVAIVLAAIAAGGIAAGYGQVVTDSNLVIAAATLAIGVAGQEIIGSVISGLFLVANSDFNTGDWIHWDDQDGEIVSIHFRTTRVRTPNNEIVTVPNTELTENAVRHRFGLDRIRQVDVVDISYESDVQTAIDRLEEAAATTPAVLSTPPPYATLQQLADDRIVLRLEYWVEDPSVQTLASARSAVGLAIVDAFGDDVVELGPSTTTLDGEVQVRLSDERA